MAEAPRLVPIWVFSRRASPNPVTHCKPAAEAASAAGTSTRQKRWEHILHVLYMPYYFDKSGNMESEQAILSFAALAQPTRLEVFRLLVRAEPKGISAGELAKSLAVPANTLSSHLNVMTRAGLVRGERHSRTIIYRARVDELRALIGFLLKDCCDGRPDICAPILDDISCCTKATCL